MRRIAASPPLRTYPTLLNHRHHPTPAACMHSVMGSLLAAVWRGQPTGEEEGEQDWGLTMEEEALALGVATLAASTSTLAASAAAAVSGAAAVVGRGLVGRDSAAPRLVGGSGSVGFRSSGGSGGASFGRPVAAVEIQPVVRPASSTAGAAASSAVSNQGTQGGCLASSPAGQQVLSGEELSKLLDSRDY